MAENTVAETAPARREETEVQATREVTRYLKPAVDIYETDDRLSVVADVPGVTRDGLDIQVNKGILSILGHAGTVNTDGLVLQEWGLSNFYREFRLSEQIDQEGIEAHLDHGVLTLHLPKVKEALPRRIEVKVG